MSRLKDTLENAYWVCNPCGKKYGSRSRNSSESTMHKDTCDICGRETFVIEFRDFGYQRELLPREKFTKEHLGE